MRFAGRVFKVGRWWAIEVAVLDVVTQGRTKRDAYRMIADAIESLVDKRSFKVDVHPGRGDYFEVSAKDQATLFAFLLRQRRVAAGLSLEAVRQRLGLKSRNAYARYEQGTSVPTVDKLAKLLKAVDADADIVISKTAAA